MQKAKAQIWLFPENIRRVEKQADSYFGGRVDAQEIPGGKPEVWLALPSELCRMTLSRVEFLTLAPGIVLFCFYKSQICKDLCIFRVFWESLLSQTLFLFLLLLLLGFCTSFPFLDRQVFRWQKTGRQAFNLQFNYHSPGDLEHYLRATLGHSLFIQEWMGSG